LRLGYKGKVLIEKPLFHNYNVNDEMLICDWGNVYVGYVLRFNSLIQTAKQWLENQVIYSMDVYCGQYLPNWRPNVDYRRSYSANELGGGVVNDLSHELDYIQFLSGKWQSVVALSGHITKLEIASNDICSCLLKTEKCFFVSCHLNYWDHNNQRRCTINAEKGTMVLNFIDNHIYLNGKMTHYTEQRNEQFKAMHEAVLRENTKNACVAQEAMQTLRLIKAIENSNASQQWIHNL